jgi:hypothetical protein
MAPRKKPAVEISAESLRLDAPQPEGVNVGGFLPADGTEVDLPVEPVVETPQTPAAELEHNDIGLWEAVRWKGVPMWRHRRTGQNTFKRDEARRLRNLK